VFPFFKYAAHGDFPVFLSVAKLEEIANLAR